MLLWIAGVMADLSIPIYGNDVIMFNLFADNKCSLNIGTSYLNENEGIEVDISKDTNSFIQLYQGFVTLYANTDLAGNSMVITPKSGCISLKGWNSFQFDVDPIIIVYGDADFTSPMFQMTDPNNLEIEDLGSVPIWGQWDVYDMSYLRGIEILKPFSVVLDHQQVLSSSNSDIAGFEGYRYYALSIVKPLVVFYQNCNYTGWAFSITDSMILHPSSNVNYYSFNNFASIDIIKPGVQVYAYSDNKFGHTNSSHVTIFRSSTRCYSKRLIQSISLKNLNQNSRKIASISSNCTGAASYSIFADDVVDDLNTFAGGRRNTKYFQYTDRKNTVIELFFQPNFGGNPIIVKNSSCFNSSIQSLRLQDKKNFAATVVLAGNQTIPIYTFSTYKFSSKIQSIKVEKGFYLQLSNSMGSEIFRATSQNNNISTSIFSKTVSVLADYGIFQNGVNTGLNSVELRYIYYGEWSTFRKNLVKDFSSNLDKSHWFQVLKGYGCQNVSYGGSIDVGYPDGNYFYNNLDYLFFSMIQPNVKHFNKTNKRPVYIVMVSPDVTPANEDCELHEYKKTIDIIGGWVIFNSYCTNGNFQLMNSTIALNRTSTTSNKDADFDLGMKHLAKVIAGALTNPYTPQKGSWYHPLNLQEASDLCGTNFGRNLGNSSIYWNQVVGRKRYFLWMLWNNVLQKCVY